MRDLTSKQKAVVTDSGSGHVDNEKRKILSFVNDDVSGAILDTSFQRMLKKEKAPTGTALNLGPLELWSDDVEGKGDFGQYRSRLVCFMWI